MTACGPLRTAPICMPTWCWRLPGRASIHALVEAMRRQPREEALNNIGYIALLKKDYRSAISYFEQALEASPRWYPRAAANLERARQEAAAARSAASE